MVRPLRCRHRVTVVQIRHALQCDQQRVGRLEARKLGERRFDRGNEIQIQTDGLALEFV